MTIDGVAGYQLLREGCGALWLHRDVVRVSGVDAASFLQGQLSQDIDAIPAGGSAWSLILQPQGKVDALVRVVRLAPGGDTAGGEGAGGADAVGGGFLLDTDAGWGSVVVERLTRFRMRVKVDFEPLEWRCLALRGPLIPPVAGAIAAGWPGLDGVDLLGPDPSLPTGIELVGREVWEAARIEAGIPVMGAELTERTIPAEATGVVERTVSFTKGCFTGQELVARIDSRGGNVPRRLRGLTIDGADVAVPPGGAVLSVGDRDVGAVTSAARHPSGHAVALAYVRRDVDLPAVVMVAGGGVAQVHALALLS